MFACFCDIAYYFEAYYYESVSLLPHLYIYIYPYFGTCIRRIFEEYEWQSFDSGNNGRKGFTNVKKAGILMKRIFSTFNRQSSAANVYINMLRKFHRHSCDNKFLYIVITPFHKLCKLSQY